MLIGGEIRLRRIDRPDRFRPLQGVAQRREAGARRGFIAGGGRADRAGEADEENGAGCEQQPAPLHRQAAFFRWSRTRTSAICTAFKAAPLRRLSETTQRLRPKGTVGSLRMRLT